MKSRIEGLIFTFICTLAIYSIIKNGIPEKIIRFLDINDIRNEFCEKSSKDLQKFYENTEPNYKFEPSEDSKLLEEIMKKIITDSSEKINIIDEVKRYFKKRPLYIFMLILFIILCILFIPYICCICCKCCLCVPDSCAKCPKIILIVGLILCGITLVNCFIGYSRNSSIIDGIYGLGCAILKLEYHLIQGDEYKSRPYWAGIRTILDKLSQTIEDINSLQGKTDELREEYSTQISKLFDDFSVALSEEYSDKSQTKITNPNYESEEKQITPSYISLYGPPTKEKTTLNNIQIEIDENKEVSDESVKKILDIIDEATDQVNDISDNIKETKKNLENGIQNLDNSLEEKIMEYKDDLDTIDSYSRKIMNIFFSINLVIVIVVGVSLISLLLFKTGLCLLCISWNFLYILMLLTLFFGAVLGLIGSFTQDASSAISTIIQDEETYENFDSKAQDIARICINGNGSLAQSSFLPNDFNISIVDNVYDLEKNINKIIEEIKNYNPISTAINLKIYNSIASKNNLTELYYALLELRKNTDSKVSDSKIKSTNINDEWEIYESDCEYPYTQKKDSIISTIGENNEYCFILTEWTEEEIYQRYDTNVENNIRDTIVNYYNSITQFNEENNEIIKDIKLKNGEFNQTFKDIGVEEANFLKKIADLIIPLREHFVELVGDNSIFEILNCQFLKRDVNKIFEELYNGFGKSFIKTSSLLITISIFEIIITLVVIIIMKTFKKGNSEEIENNIKY